MRIPSPALKRRGLLWVGLGAVLVMLVALAAVKVTRSDAAPHQYCCAPPPDPRVKIRGVAQQWQIAVAHGDTQAAWELLTPQAQRRYGSVGGLRAALARLTPHPRGAVTWQEVSEISPGSGTPGLLSLLMLVEDGTMRPVGAIVVHSPGEGIHDGQVDPDVAATVRILEPVPQATVGTRPWMRVRSSSPPEYFALQADGRIPGAVRDIRGADGIDAPFASPSQELAPGQTLIVAVEADGKGKFSYGSVQVAVR